SDIGEIAFCYVSDDPNLRQVGDTIEFVTGADPLAVDDTLANYGPGRRRRPIDSTRIDATLTQLLDTVFRNAEITQPAHRPVEARLSKRRARLPAARDDEQVGQCLLDV